MSSEIKVKVFFLLGLIFIFGIGFMSGKIYENTRAMPNPLPIEDIGQISTQAPVLEFFALDKNLLYGKTNGMDVRLVSNSKAVSTFEDATNFFIDLNLLPTKKSLEISQTYSFVASKNGQKYHLIGSGDGNRISEENKIYFKTKEEAEKKGYTAGNSVK